LRVPSTVPSPGGPSVSLISTYPPRVCGIATFARDLAHALEAAGVGVSVAALEDETHAFSSEVTDIIGRDRGSSVRMARQLAERPLDAVLVQHEYGIFGGEDGEHVLDLVRASRHPVITTVHTLLEHPRDRQRAILRGLVEASTRAVVMSNGAASRLVDVYDADPEKVRVIPHGVPDLAMISTAPMKAAMGWPTDRPLVLSFGLLGPGKGYELAIEAMTTVVGQVPDARYVIAGTTHPEQRRVAGESYRESLKALAADRGISRSVEFVDGFMSQEALGRWLQSADVYVTPYPGADQIVSGTLAYAMGAGRAIVATPYAYASEMLAEGRGSIVPFDDPAAMSAAIVRYLTDPEARAGDARRAYRLGRTMTWSSVGEAYRALIDEVAGGAGDGTESEVAVGIRQSRRRELVALDVR
jgi:glycosyltransferase involved in cell wall biosynthesis